MDDQPLPVFGRRTERPPATINFGDTDRIGVRTLARDFLRKAEVNDFSVRITWSYWYIQMEDNKMVSLTHLEVQYVPIGGLKSKYAKKKELDPVVHDFIFP